MLQRILLLIEIAPTMLQQCHTLRGSSRPILYHYLSSLKPDILHAANPLSFNYLIIWVVPGKIGSRKASDGLQFKYKTWPNIVLPLSKCMGFAHKGLWGMAYHGFMGYGVQFPANQVGGSIRLWDITGYGLCQVWVKAGSTVLCCWSCCRSMSIWKWLMPAPRVAPLSAWHNNFFGLLTQVGKGRYQHFLVVEFHRDVRDKELWASKLRDLIADRFTRSWSHQYGRSVNDEICDSVHLIFRFHG